MSNQLQLAESAPAQPTENAPSASGHSVSVAASAMVCDLAESTAFFDLNGKPHIPILAAFGGDRLHLCKMEGTCDLDRAVSENTDALVRSRHFVNAEKKAHRWDDLTFQFGPRSFVYADTNRILGYASSYVEAERLVTQFCEAYRKPPAPAGGTFYLIKTSNEISTEAVPLGAETILSDELLGLHYAGEAVTWHHDFTETLRGRNHGLSILEGPPGTGKTSYLRHLMGTLKESHRFYFIPTASMGVLSHSDFIGFWAGQRHIHSGQKFVVVLEDSDAALMARGSDNREQVSAILNLSDGMLADFLRLQIVCTINCTSADIDPALLRPGRLLCHRVFSKLDYPHAVRLAESLGKTLPTVRDYSLAEVFAGNGTREIDRPHMGFAA